MHTTEIKKKNGYKSEIENLYLISIEFDTIALTGEFVDNVKYKIQQRADNVYIHPIDSIPDYCCPINVKKSRKDRLNR